MEPRTEKHRSVLMVTWYKLVREMIEGANEDPKFRALVHTVVGLLVVGTIFFSLNQGWNLIDSFYFSVTTLTTVGYGDFAPTGSGARLAAVAYQLAGIGVFVLLVSELARRSVVH
ncbi:MAG: two pore domain potassium channel family protein, partial [Thermoleophilia bacterium]|nr:two pore domain potassium channel family protein [Thermoleophilia bacterium]